MPAAPPGQDPVPRHSHPLVPRSDCSWRQEHSQTRGQHPAPPPFPSPHPATHAPLVVTRDANAVQLSSELQQFIKIASCHSTPLTSTTHSHKHNSQPQREATKAGRWTLPLNRGTSLTNARPPQMLNSLLSPDLPSPLSGRLVFLTVPISIQTKGPKIKCKMQKRKMGNPNEREGAKKGHDETEAQGSIGETGAPGETESQRRDQPDKPLCLVPYSGPSPHQARRVRAVVGGGAPLLGDLSSKG